MKSNEVSGQYRLGRIQNLFNFCGNIRLLQLVEKFQRPDNFGNDQQTGR
jgi:hypothetical protein